MKYPNFRNLLAGAALMGGLTAGAQGLEGVIVEEYHTITQGDADFINAQGGDFEIPVGAKVYRVYVDMAPNYRFLNVFASPNNSNPVNIQTTTTFWNAVNMTGASADFTPGLTRNLMRGVAFDSYITVHTTGKSGSTVQACTSFGGGSSANTQQVGVLRSDDPNGNGTLCNSYPGITGTDGHIQNPFALAVPNLTTNLSGVLDFSALEADGSQLTFINDSWATLPAQTGVDPTGTNRVLIGQFTTAGTFSFQINVAISNPSNQIEEYVHSTAAAGQQVSSFLTFPQACVPPVITSATSNSPICAGQTLNLNATATGTAPLNFTWTGAGTISNGGTANATVTGAATGNYNIAVSNACGSVNQNVAVTVNPAPSATISYAGSPYCTGGGTANVTFSGSTGGTYSSSAGLSINPSNGAVNLGASTPGTYTVTYTVAAAGGCSQFQTTASITINQSTNNTTTQSACDSFTWSVNGSTYTQSGTYTSVNGCATETLVLTITPSTNNTTTQSACDSYTWPVNGQTYTQSGTYTSVNGCATQTLVLTITPSTSNTTTISQCDTYTWPVNGQTYTQSGTYTSVNGCATEILVLTILQSGTNTTTQSACDSFTWSVNGQTYTQSGTYTSVTGCSTEVLVLTITPSTSNTTTQSACDSFTWSVNGQTYTQSGTYTSVNGCVTEILVLTITPSTSNTTTVSECNTYTWPVNGQTYTQSGTYTSVNGCVTEILVLTILQSGTNTTTQSACDSFTWSVNGQTYTQSGTYTSVTGCSTEILVLTITPSTSNTTTVSECDSYTWSVNGQTYTQSGTYNSVNGCNTEILVLTITPSTTNTTTENACSSYTWSVNGQTYTQSGTYTSVNGCVTEVLVLTVSIPGTACNDGNPGTIDDVLDANCNCVGTPTGCTENITLNITLDAFGSQTTWSLLLQGTSTVVEQGGPYTDGIAGTVIVEELCVPAGCYRLVVSDAAGDGINGGGYVLRTSGANGQRIVDNSNNGGFASTSAIIGNGGFCLPLGTDKLIFTSCDKLDWVSGQFIVASENPAVSALWVPNAPNSQQSSTTGYQFWFFDPNGTYGYARFRSHATSDGYPANGATRACHLRINNWSPNQIPTGVLMNVKVRSRINGVNSAWGPACRFKIDPVRAACPLTKLNDIPGQTTFSCGVTRNWGGSNRLWARPVSGATQYQFRFESGETGVVVRTTTTQVLQLNWNPALPNGTYSVQVRAFVNGAWCATNLPWGDACNVTITGSPVSSQSLVLGGASTEVSEATLVLFPNPNNGQQLTVSLSAVEEGVQTVSVDIFDMSGARVSAQTIAVNDGMLFEQVAVNELASGLYMVNITAGGKRYTERLVINK
jgi:hypothetical protein